MPHSPYLTTVYPPIQDVDEYKRDLSHHRASWEDGERDKERDGELLVIGEELVEHCNFLETKLDIKKREYNQLAVRKDKLEKENEALKKESETQKMEISALKNKLERMEATTGTEEQLGSKGDCTGVEEEAKS